MSLSGGGSSDGSELSGRAFKPTPKELRWLPCVTGKRKEQCR